MSNYYSGLEQQQMSYSQALQNYQVQVSEATTKKSEDLIPAEMLGGEFLKGGLGKLGSRISAKTGLKSLRNLGKEPLSKTLQNTAKEVSQKAKDFASDAVKKRLGSTKDLINQQMKDNGFSPFTDEEFSNLKDSDDIVSAMSSKINDAQKVQKALSEPTPSVAPDNFVGQDAKDDLESSLNDRLNNLTSKDYATGERVSKQVSNVGTTGDFYGNENTTKAYDPDKLKAEYAQKNKIVDDAEQELADKSAFVDEAAAYAKRNNIDPSKFLTASELKQQAEDLEDKGVSALVKPSYASVVRSGAEQAVTDTPQPGGSLLARVLSPKAEPFVPSAPEPTLAPVSEGGPPPVAPASVPEPAPSVPASVPEPVVPTSEPVAASVPEPVVPVTEEEGGTDDIVDTAKSLLSNAQKASGLADDAIKTTSTGIEDGIQTATKALGAADLAAGGLDIFGDIAEAGLGVLGAFLPSILGGGGSSVAPPTPTFEASQQIGVTST